MRTVNTIRAAFSKLEQAAPTGLPESFLEHTVHAPTRASWLVRWRMPLAIAAAICAVLVASSFALGFGRSNSAPANPHPSPPSLGAHKCAVSGGTVIVTGTGCPSITLGRVPQPTAPTTPSYISWSGHTPDGWASSGSVECGSTSPFGPVVKSNYVGNIDDCGSALRYRPNTLDVSKVMSGSRVMVNGHNGYSLRLAYLPDAIDAPTPVPTVAWEYGSGYWAVVQTDKKMTPAATLALARANAAQIEDPGNNPVSTKVAPASPVPVNFGYRPKVLTELASGQLLPKPIGTPILFVTNYSSTDKKTTLKTDLYGPNAETGPPPAVPTAHTDITIQGHVIQVGDHTIDAVIGKYAIHISYSGPDALPSDTLKIAKAMTLPTNMDDPKTWFDGGSMLP
ncbi:hypothetical protein ACSMXN_22630 [Jatrophihabitans sp. DSM 45814]